jgi:hypothetical protein
MLTALVFNYLFTGSIQFIVTIQKASGKFEIVEGNASVVSGSVQVPANVSYETVELEPLKPLSDGLLELSSRDIYKELQLRGYEFQGLFHSLVCADNYGGYQYMLQESLQSFSFSLISLVLISHNCLQGS